MEEMLFSWKIASLANMLSTTISALVTKSGQRAINYYSSGLFQRMNWMNFEFILNPERRWEVPSFESRLS